jgi:phage baseplate assembly protein W
MAGFSPRLPLALDSLNGFALTQTIHETGKQNLRMLVLTNPGERVMIPDFGAGIRQMLFEQQSPGVLEMVKERIISQVKKYLPYIKIANVRIFNASDSKSQNQNFNAVSVIIDYSIPKVRINDSLRLNVSTVQL